MNTEPTLYLLEGYASPVYLPGDGGAHRLKAVFQIGDSEYLAVDALVQVEWLGE